MNQKTTLESQSLYGSNAFYLYPSRLNVGLEEVKVEPVAVKTQLAESSLVSAIKPAMKISQGLPGYIRYIQFELCMARQSVKKYQEALRWIIRDIGDIPIEEISPAHITLLKQMNFSRGAGESRMLNIVFALKSFLNYCRDSLGLMVMDSAKVKSPKRSRREVEFLDSEEIKAFIDAIKIENQNPQKNKNTPKIRMDGLRFRTLVEVLLGTGMRISEALSLQRGIIDWEKAEAKIIGKGNKERTVFFTPRCLQWIKYYLDQRNDQLPYLFITQRGTPLKREDISGLFRRYGQKAGIKKKLTPHILRHTVATNLLFNGCPISHVKEILGHSKLETTCRYYLGLDKTKAKEAHSTFLRF